MKVIDVASASSFAMMSIVLLLVINPGPIHDQGRAFVASLRAHDLLLQFLGKNDLHFLAIASVESLCSSARSFSNSSAFIIMTVNEAECPASPLPGAYDGLSGATITLGNRKIAIEAWVRAEP